MQILKFESREEWLFNRRGKITGSRLKDIVVKRGTGKKIGYYELIAERLGVPPETDENAMERGHRLEVEALDRFEKETGRKVDRSLYIWTRDDNESIAVSPDGVVEETDATEAVEAKCLSSARHIEAWLTKEIPDEYQFQKLQYFIVNDKLEKLHFVFFDPRFAMFTPSGELQVGEDVRKVPLDYFELEINRADVQKEVDEYLEYQRKVIEEVNKIVNEITF